MYLLFGSFTACLSVLLSVIIRIELAFPGHQILFGQYQLYNVIVTMHGVLMLFFVVGFNFIYFFFSMFFFFLFFLLYFFFLFSAYNLYIFFFV
jgi:heme/copper-type cytochrome/quinol oxidase subunit 1